jgi:hypothetical protein
MADTAFKTTYVGAPKKMAKPKNWIKAATPKKTRGTFSKKAKAAGMSTKAFAAKKANAPGKLGKEARLAKTLMSFKGSLAD